MDKRGASSDTELLAAAQAGDADAFGAFYVRYREQALAYFSRRLRRPELAADLTAELFARALETVLTREPTPEAPAPWLFTIARNLLVDSVRRGRVETSSRHRLGMETLVLDDHDLDRVAEISEAADLLERLQTHLSAEDWAALRARFLDDESYVDLAQRLQCSQAVARKRVSRALALLRTANGGSSG